MILNYFLKKIMLYPTVQLLLRLGASVNQADSSGESPLHLACSHGYVAVAEVLLQQSRPNINARTLQGTTALHAAAAQGSCGEKYKHRMETSRLEYCVFF